MITFGVAVIADLWFVGKEVINAVGYELTIMHPVPDFSAKLSAANLVMVSSIWGVPVSSTRILIGAIMSAGLVNRRAN